MASVDPISSALARAFRDEGARVRGALMHAIGDLGVAEDALAAACEQALISWPSSGVPQVPAAWLTLVAKKKAIDVLRRRRSFANKVEVIARLGENDRDDAADLADRAVLSRRDDRLGLLFVACHPVLANDEQVALTLQVVGGLTSTEISRAFLVPVTTMEKRLARAKTKLREARVAFEVPRSDEMGERLAAVLAAVYLIFNEGYLSSRGEVAIRKDLCAEALRIARLLQQLLDSEGRVEPEVTGLLALLLFTHARSAARVDGEGGLVLLEHQDRSLWDERLIKEGLRLVDSVLVQRRPGPYQIQAAIAALHAEAKDAAATDWAQIAALYAGLVRLQPTAVVRLNHAVAVAMAHGVDAGLSLVDVLGREGSLDGYHLYWATRAELQRRQGDVAAARRAFQRARTLAPSAAERDFLSQRIAQLTPR